MKLNINYKSFLVITAVFQLIAVCCYAKTNAIAYKKSLKQLIEFPVFTNTVLNKNIYSTKRDSTFIIVRSGRDKVFIKKCKGINITLYLNEKGKILKIHQQQEQQRILQIKSTKP